MPILRIKDENGNFIPIPAIRGDNGKSAYEQAKEGGFAGTEQEFIALLNGLTSTEDAAHYADFNNPHRVTAEQLGLGNVAVDEYGAVKIGKNTTSVVGYGGITIGDGSAVTGNGVAVGKGAKASGVGNGGAVGGSAETQSGGSIGESAKSNRGGAVGSKTETDGGGAVGLQARSTQGGAVGYGAKTGEGAAIGYYAETVDDAGNLLNAIQLGNGKNKVAGTMQVYNYLLMDALGKIPVDRFPSELVDGSLHVAQGSYKGTNTYGTSKPNTLTFEFVPKFVVVAKRGTSNIQSGGTFIWIYPGTTLNFINNGSTYWCYPSLDGTTFSWYNTESAAYQLNSSNYEYDYLAWG